MSDDKKLMWYGVCVEARNDSGEHCKLSGPTAWMGECNSQQEAMIKATEYAIKQVSVYEDECRPVTLSVQKPTEYPDWPLLSELRDWYWGIGVRANFEAMDKAASFIGHPCKQIDDAARQPFVEMTQIVLDRENLGMMEFSERAFVDWMGTFAHKHENARVLLDELRAKLVSHMFSLVKDGMKNLHPSEEGAE